MEGNMRRTLSICPFIHPSVCFSIFHWSVPHLSDVSAHFLPNHSSEWPEIWWLHSLWDSLELMKFWSCSTESPPRFAPHSHLNPVWETCIHWHLDITMVLNRLWFWTSNINRFCAEAGIFWGNFVNAMAADALTLCHQNIISHGIDSVRLIYPFLSCAIWQWWKKQ